MLNRLLLILTILGLIGISVVHAQNLTLTWDAPTENTDGTPVSNLPLTYTIYCGSSPGTEKADYPTVIHDITTTTHTFAQTGTYYCRVTATNTLSNESELSDECSNVRPSPPTGCRIQ